MNSIYTSVIILLSNVSKQTIQLAVSGLSYLNERRNCNLNKGVNNTNYKGAKQRVKIMMLRRGEANGLKPKMMRATQPYPMQ